MGVALVDGIGRGTDAVASGLAEGAAI